MTPDPNTEDVRPQPDPELQTSIGRASPAQIVVTAIGAVAIVVLVLYGLTHQRDESERATAAAPASETTGAAPPASQQDASKQQANQSQPSGQGDQAQSKQHANQGGKPAQPNQQTSQSGQQPGSNQGDHANQPQGHAQSGAGTGNASPRTTSGVAPSEPTGPAASAQSSTGGARPAK